MLKTLFNPNALGRKIWLLTIGLLVLSISLYSQTTVYDIQYTTNPGPDGTYPSPMEGETVTVIGIVHANSYSGDRFFITDPGGGPWHGIYVYEWDTNPQIGDEVEVTGEVSEYYGFTEIGYADVTILSSGNPVPEPILVSTGDLIDPADAEQYEGVLVKIEDVEVTQEPDQYGQWYVDDGSGECQIDDQIYEYQPTLGENIAHIIGVVDYSYSEYAINPRFAEDIGVPPGYIEGTVTLNGGSGNVEDVEVTAGSVTVNPDGNGDYQITIVPGTYDVTASLVGYSPQTIEDVVVQSGQVTSNINFILEPVTYTPIHDIQFTTNPGPDSTYPSPMEGQIVTITGIVNANSYSEEKFFIADPEGGAWNGIYIYEWSTSPEIGDEVEITGEVSEYYGFTEIGYADVTILSSGNPVPEPVLVNTGNLIYPVDAEQYEGVLVKVENVTVTDTTDEYGQWYVDDGTGECQIDDQIFGYEPYIGETFDYIIGVVDYAYSEYGINPRDSNDVHSSVPIDDNQSIIPCFTLKQNYPNPFPAKVGSRCISENPKTNISYQIPRSSNVEIYIYNIKGELVRTLVNEEKSAGYHNVIWNGKDEEGRELPSGIYLYKMITDRHTSSKKMLLMK